MTLSGPASSRRSPLRRILAVAALLVIAAVGMAAYFVVPTVPVRYDVPDERYKYGSFGTEADSMPVLIWEALPDVCPDKLPGGWAQLGAIYEGQRRRPVGISESRLGGIDRMGVNCAFCHVGAVQEKIGAPLQVIVGMPNQRLDFQRYVSFILSCVGDQRFTPDNVVAAMRSHGPVSATQAAFYKTLVIPTVKRKTAEKAGSFSWFNGRPEAGPGRLDTPNSLKRMLGVNISAESIGTVDFPAVWNQAPRAKAFVHWDANSPSLSERDHITAAIAGATTESLDNDEIKWIEEWLNGLAPPKYPYAIDEARVTRGQAVYQEQCALCHVQRALDVTAAGIIGTDRNRLEALSGELVTKMNAFGGGRGGTAHYRSTGGYSNVLLDGVWARAPYLHNGSVPTLADLLEPPDRRPVLFYSGSSVYDQDRLGFVSNGPGAGPFRFDTKLPGNGNAGHDYGTQLTPEQKRDLLEFLKKQ